MLNQFTRFFEDMVVNGNENTGMRCPSDIGSRLLTRGRCLPQRAMLNFEFQKVMHWTKAFCSLALLITVVGNVFLAPFSSEERRKKV